jgi:DNA-binding SARP family transcriptional activator
VLDINLLGPLSVESEGRRLGPRDFGGVKPKQLLEVLLLERGHPVPKDRLADLIWGEALPRKVSATLETYVSVLRRNLQPDARMGASAIITEPGAYRFDVAQATIDLDRFDHLVDRARREASRVARRTLEEAITIVRGELLEDEPYASWAEDHRHHYHERYLQVLNDAAEAALGEREFLPALEHAHRAVAVDRLSERGYRIAMLASYALGRQGDALRAYERCRRVLDEELGVEPLPETRFVHEAISRHDDISPLLPAPPTERVAVRRPEPSRPALLGRTEELAQLRDAIEHSLDGVFTLVLVSGEAGIGKTRLLDELTGSIAIATGHARCSQLERELPYVPLAGALRGLLDIFAVDPVTMPALSPILPEVAGGPVTQIQAFEAVVDLAETHAPFVVLIDDLHWADDATLAALAYIQRRCAHAAITVVATYRSDQVDAAHPIHRLQPSVRINLGPLSPADLEPLGDGELHSKTGGYPLFVEAHLAGGSAERMQQLVAARTSVAGPLGQRLLVAAAVLTDPFDPEPLARICDADVNDVVDELEALCTQGLLAVHEEGFGFRQQAVREVLAESVSPARRRLMLARAAQAMPTAIRREDDGALIVDLRDAVAEVLADRAQRRDNLRPVGSGESRQRHPSTGWTRDPEPDPT